MSTPIGAGLDGRDNALNFLRLVLASAVIVGHAWPLGGFGTSRLEGISGLAVNGFFALSGYLIAGSRMRLSMNEFLVRRCLRILPGFWACLLVIAFFFAPLSTLISGEHYSVTSGVQFVLHDAMLTMHQWGVEDTLLAVPYPETWDGSLWTLEFEFAAYVASGLLLSVLLVRRHPAIALGLLFTLALLAQPVAHALDVNTLRYVQFLRLGCFFVGGMLAWSLRDRLPVRADLTWLSGGAVVVLFFTVDETWLNTLSAVPLTYALLALGVLLRVRIGSVNDVSYGVYIYAFPVAQILALTGSGDLGVVGFSILVFALTVPCAWASWLLVERPAMRAGSRWIRRRQRLLAPQPG